MIPRNRTLKRLYRTHTHLRNRFLTSSYRLSVIQTRGSPPNGHANMIYCVQLYTYPTTKYQVIFTGSRDKTIREWNLCTGEVERVFGGVHTESVLSLCARNGWMVSAGSDWRVVLWNLDGRSLGKGKGIDGNRSGGSAAVKVLRDRADSVLCVRFGDERLVSYRTVRVYTFPGLELLHVLGGHRAAVNAISLSKDYVVPGSGHRSMNVWDVKTGKLIRTFEYHHTRTSPHPRHSHILHHPYPLPRRTPIPTTTTTSSSSSTYNSHAPIHPYHTDLVRGISLGLDFIITGSYDLSVKTWDHTSGVLVAYLTEGHTGKIFCVAADKTKVASCGEDLRICVWNFSRGVEGVESIQSEWCEREMVGLYIFSRVEFECISK
ncbi:F-box/WD repeat-containing protein pof11 [Leucoagaricus sp. SymC.cos]|nr:F-box/WD repeat-containing protein pof11 [Leucoagaricus sp. SymC.cos]